MWDRIGMYLFFVLKIHRHPFETIDERGGFLGDFRGIFWLYWPFLYLVLFVIFVRGCQLCSLASVEIVIQNIE